MLRALSVRDVASRRVRRWTVATVAAATGLTGIFAGLAAGSTHAAKRAGAAATRSDAPVTAPAPSLEPAEAEGSEGESSHGSDDGSGSGGAQQAPAPPPSAAAPTTPPAAVSGGS